MEEKKFFHKQIYLKRELEDNFKDPTKIVKFKADGIKEYRRDFYYFGNRKHFTDTKNSVHPLIFARGVIRQRFDNSRIVRTNKS